MRVDDDSPQSVAHAYFQLAARGGYIPARHLVWEADREGAPDGGGLLAADIVSVGQGATEDVKDLPAEYRSFAAAWELPIGYHSRFTDEVGDPPGDHVVSVILGRETPTSPWRVVELDSGP